MKRLFTFNVGENAQLGLLKDLVETAFIPCMTRNDYLSAATGGIPFTECYPELWILNDEDYPRAKEVLDRWLTPRMKDRIPGCVAPVENISRANSCLAGNAGYLKKSKLNSILKDILSTPWRACILTSKWNQASGAPRDFLSFNRQNDCTTKSISNQTRASAG